MAVLFIYGSEKKRGSFSCWSSRVSGGYSVAVFAAFLRAKAPKYWRAFHALMYVVLLFGIVHANLFGAISKIWELRLFLMRCLFLPWLVLRSRDTEVTSLKEKLKADFR